MTSSDFLLCYASVTTALFDQIEHDMLVQSCAFIDDDETTLNLPCDVLAPPCTRPMDLPMT